MSKFKDQVIGSYFESEQINEAKEEKSILKEITAGLRSSLKKDFYFNSVPIGFGSIVAKGTSYEDSFLGTMFLISNGEKAFRIRWTSEDMSKVKNIDFWNRPTERPQFTADVDSSLDVPQIVDIIVKKINSGSNKIKEDSEEKAIQESVEDIAKSILSIRRNIFTEDSLVSVKNIKNTGKQDEVKLNQQKYVTDKCDVPFSDMVDKIKKEKSEINDSNGSISTTSKQKIINLLIDDEIMKLSEEGRITNFSFRKFIFFCALAETKASTNVLKKWIEVILTKGSFDSKKNDSKEDSKEKDEKPEDEEKPEEKNKETETEKEEEE